MKWVLPSKKFGWVNTISCSLNLKSCFPFRISTRSSSLRKFPFFQWQLLVFQNLIFQLDKAKQEAATMNFIKSCDSFSRSANKWLKVKFIGLVPIGFYSST
uniref:Uncharacterized protein n=1 Tax=Oxyrrhis marina TaxID=2969 RepID=A0A7S4GMY4_OXYMA|mmetsp:Transcript_62368/g.167019  ORF Transcript_62368/g.167019 Transcript_62368/m.167019 type:complete len:101 (-) Transcript_62368:224-526(-)